jgi:hypothetical protein
MFAWRGSCVKKERRDEKRRSLHASPHTAASTYLALLLWLTIIIATPEIISITPITFSPGNAALEADAKVGAGETGSVGVGAGEAS